MDDLCWSDANDPCSGAASSNYPAARELRFVIAMKRKPPKKPLPIRPVPEKVLEQAAGGTERRGGGWDANHNHKRLRVEPPAQRRKG